MPSFNIQLISDLKAQLADINQQLKDAQKQAKATQQALQQAAKAGGALPRNQLNTLAQQQNNVASLQQQQLALKTALSTSAGRAELAKTIVETFNKSKDVAEKIGRVVNAKLIKDIAYGGEIKAADVGNFLEKVAARIPGVYGKAAQLIAGGASAGLSAATDARDAQGQFARGEISREQLSLIEAEKAGSFGLDMSGARNLASKFGIIQDQASRQKELVDETKGLAGIAQLGKTRLNELLKEAGSSANADELFSRILAQESKMVRQRGRALTAEEVSEARANATAEELEKGAITEGDILRIENAEKQRAERRAAPPIIGLATRLGQEQAGLREAAHRVPARIRD